jgi:hypothetical protein
MKIVTARFDDDASVRRIVEGLNQLGVTNDMISVSEGARELIREHGHSRAPSGAPHGGMMVTAEVHDELVDAVGTAVQRAGGSSLEVREAGGVGSMGRNAPYSDAPAVSADGFGVRDAAEPSEANDWNARERLERATDMGDGAAAGGVMGAPIGAGTTAAAGGIMGATPGEVPADDTQQAEDLLQSDDIADVERRRRAADPAP